MLKPYKIADYISEYKPDWACTMPDGCPPENVLVLIEGEAKARRNLKLPMFRRYQGIIALTLQPADGVEKQTGAHRSHYTWWRTTAFQMSNLNMLAI